MSLDIKSRTAGKRQGLSRFVRTIKNIIITILVLVALAFAAGMLYTWWMGRTNPVEIPDAPVSEPTSVTRPAAISDTAKIGVASQMLTSPVTPGSNVTMSIKTNPKAACSIRVEYNNQASTDTGLIPKTADEYGVVTWSWKVEIGRPLGEWPVTVTCANAKNSGVYVGKLVVKSPTE